MDSYLTVLKKYAVFEGRAARKEYWMFVLVNLGIVIAGSLVFGLLKGLTKIDLSFIMSLYSLGVLVPSIAVGVRRLHDTDRTGLWMLVSFVPFLGGLALLVLMALEGSPADNRFGPNPYRAITDSSSRSF